MRVSALAVAVIGLSFVPLTGLAESAPNNCSAGGPNCVEVGKFNFSIGVGAGLHTNPLPEQRNIPDVKECWENFRSGTYTVQLTFAEDLTFQLRDPQLRAVLASKILRVIREAIQYRQRRREVWDIFG